MLLGRFALASLHKNQTSARMYEPYCTKDMSPHVLCGRARMLRYSVFAMRLGREGNFTIQLPFGVLSLSKGKEMMSGYLLPGAGCFLNASAKIRGIFTPCCSSGSSFIRDSRHFAPLTT
jgi:hypothetical protein